MVTARMVLLFQLNEENHTLNAVNFALIRLAFHELILYTQACDISYCMYNVNFSEKKKSVTYLIRKMINNGYLQNTGVNCFWRQLKNLHFFFFYLLSIIFCSSSNFQYLHVLTAIKYDQNLMYSMYVLELLYLE